MSADDDREFGLVMPFTVCESQGGPFDDVAFVAGYRCGVVDAKLADGNCEEPVWSHEDELPQLDLIAMRHGSRSASTTSGTR